MKPNEHVLTLSDGRNLGFNEYGNSNGYPIFSFHGTPGSRVWFIEDDEVSKRIGVRLITVDRPGYGNSDQKANRTFLDFADDILELSQSLKLNEFSVMGGSGGGAYAAACAFKHPDFVRTAGLISTVGYFERGRLPKDMASINKITFRLAARFPWLLKYFLNQQKKKAEIHPDKVIDSISKNTKHLCESDREILSVRENAEAIMLQMKEAFKNGVTGAIVELNLYLKDWGFDCSKIEVPIEVWHGKADTLAPIASIQSLAQVLPNCNTHYVDDKGHFLSDEESIWEQILLSVKA